MIEENSISVYFNNLTENVKNHLINNGYTGNEFSIEKFSKSNKYSLNIGFEDSTYNANTDKFATIDLSLKTKYRLFIKSNILDYIKNNIKHKSDGENKYISIDFITLQELFETAKEVAFAELELYSPSTVFGCCSKYKQCSDAGKCIHDYKLYAKGCQYRKNLESGLIFYGKKQNV